jgi:hypothetical protein
MFKKLIIFINTQNNTIKYYMSFIQLVQNTLIPTHQHYYLNYSIKTITRLKEFTDKYSSIFNNDLQIIDDLYISISNIQGKRYKYDHPQTITKHPIFKHFCNQFKWTSLKAVKDLCTIGLQQNNFKGVINYLKIILCINYTLQIFDFIVPLVRKYDIFMEDPIFKAIFLKSYIKKYDTYEVIIADAAKLKLNISDVCLYIGAKTYFNNFEKIKIPINCADFFFDSPHAICIPVPHKKLILNIDKTMKYASAYVDKTDNITEIFQTYINNNKNKFLGYNLHKYVNMLNISTFNTESLIRFLESACRLSGYDNIMFKNYIFPNLSQYDASIIDRIFMAAARNHRYLLVRDMIESGYAVKEKYLVKFINNIPESYDVRNFDSYKLTLILLVNNIKNLSVIDIVPQLYCGYRASGHLYLGLLSEIFLPQHITYDVVALYCKHVYYIPNLERFGLEYGKELYDALFLLPRIPLYYLERFTHVPKDTLVNRFVFSTPKDFFNSPDESCQFIKENSTSLKINVKYGLQVNEKELVKFVKQLGIMEGYSLQSLYMKYPEVYKKISTKYDFIPQVGVLDFKLLDKNYCTFIQKIE